MSDRYGSFVQSSMGKTVAKNLGLPMPLKLDRYQAGMPLVLGDVLVGSAKDEDNSLTDAIARILTVAKSNVFVTKSDALKEKLTHAGINVQAYTGGADKYKVAIFDATAITTIDELKQVYDFFHPIARRIEKSGRVIIIGRPPEAIDDIEYSLAQRSLEGFVKSVGKEFKKGITAQLIYVNEGDELNLDSTLRFFMSARSAYVSGQVVRVGAGESIAVDWNKPLQGKTMLVTGASRGIGKAIAQTLARDGAHVICLDIPPALEALQKVAGEIGGSTLTVDITAEDAGEKIATAAAKHNGLDAVIHNAGVTRDKTLAKMDEDRWNMVLNINLASIAKINKYLLNNNVLNNNARIVCVSSISGIAGNLGQTNYATSKAGVIGLVNATAKQFATADSGLTINAVAPGFIETEMTAKIPLTIREAGRRLNSMSQGGLPVDVAETIAWLASPASGGVNGNIVRVCGQSLLGA